jgi:hypothetical protein
METPIQKQDLAQTDDNKQTLRWVALGLWSVCSPIHRSIWSGLSFWYSCEPAFKILLHLGTWIYASYNCWLLSISAQLWWNIFATSPLILYIYIHTHDIPFFWISVYLWWRYLKFFLSIWKLFGWGHHDSLPPPSSKHHSLHTPCPCKQALTRAQCYRQGYW